MKSNHQKMNALLLNSKLLQKIADDHLRMTSRYAQHTQDARDELNKIKQVDNEQDDDDVWFDC